MTDTRVVVSSSAWRDYAFPLPITALLWREIVGYEPLILLVETEEWWQNKPMPCKAAGLALGELRRFEFEVRFIGRMDDKYEHSTIAQSSRQHAACLDYPPGDWFMMSDADLWPLNKDFYYHHGGPAMTMYYSNGDHYQSYPTCHQVMQVSTWREVMGLNSNLSLADNLDATFSASLPKGGLELWCFDQHYSSRRINASRFYPALCIERKGHPPTTRIDRGNWPAVVNVAGMIDAHILKAPDENWPKLRPIIEQLLPQYLGWADKYAAEFRAGY